MRTPKLICPIHSNIVDCEEYEMGIIIPYQVNDIYTITNWIDTNMDSRLVNKAYEVYGDCIITHMIVIERLDNEVFNNDLIAKCIIINQDI